MCDVGVYGDVLRVKIMYNKRDTALVQFTEAAQAHLGGDDCCLCCWMTFDLVLLILLCSYSVFEWEGSV